MSRSSKKAPYVAPKLMKRIEAMNESGKKEKSQLHTSDLYGYLYRCPYRRDVCQEDIKDRCV